MSHDPSRPASASEARAFEARASDARAATARAPSAKFGIGDVVRHRMFPFRGVIFDVDPQFANTEEWYNAIPEPIRPRKDQPFYHLYAENSENHYVAYVSEQNLVPDETGEPVEHPQVAEMFTGFDGARYAVAPPVRARLN
jgi:heat shock protein HspQ